ncbi:MULTISPECIES: ABC transporter permease [Mesorhizobium]|jgi:ABC-type dipeptide/oligopeptide/nickel transport system permease component|uniref:Peptide/nickel transport system permease protein n=1 Tax=Rhizobium loti TaxID=381 RepID=A0A8E3B613_RHILI|nr:MULTISPECIES: ABC transporter permease [Mesorhizobium]AZO42152.1 ABC transporter permease [Mesorhizobium sp. M7D.F.Ca.US.005.01.1.1]PWJ92525.1 peptide/nickel transport system permease protein [Mesorhizobium loti]RUX97383.1 ABC transporter permease [Mesorhizobium sp. M7D.F.Ca.US.004.01.2.1]RVA25863.1 ABC transporter permease [Mesorhizobium sp. M7D.F.Ca.US.004.03.1.1]
MLAYAVKRIGLGLLILVLVMIAMYAAVFLVPGDPATVALGPRATPELKRLLIERMGLDQPVWWQIVEFFRNALTGNLGYDVWSNRPVSTLVLEALPNTLILGLTALTVALLIGVPLGCLSVMRRGTTADAIIGVLSVGVIAVPSFVVAIYSLLLFAVTLRWLPAIGAGEAGDFVSQAKALIMPAAAIALGWIGYIARMVRASMMEVMGEPHIRTARSFGLPEWKIVSKYALRIAIIPTISLVAVGLGSILSSAVFVEAVFARPGIGKLITDAVNTRNYPVVMGTVLIMTAIYVSITIAADLLIARLDPRVRDVFRG